jgi:DNA-binding HxlR family transcriptional regulator
MKKPKPDTTTFPGEFRSSCPVASVLDILGDKWTLVVVRDLFINKHRYGDFLISPEGIPTNILADRLKRLEAAGIVKRELYQDNPPRAEYFLTTRGADLAPVLRAMLKWGIEYLPGVSIPGKFAPPEIRD